MPSDDQAVAIIARLPKRFTLKALSALVILANRLIQTQAVQLKLLAMVTKGMHNSIASQIHTLLSKNDKRVFFSEEQITGTIGLVCKHGSESEQQELDLTDFFQLLVLSSSFVPTPLKPKVVSNALTVRSKIVWSKSFASMASLRLHKPTGHFRRGITLALPSAQVKQAMPIERSRGIRDVRETTGSKSLRTSEQ